MSTPNNESFSELPEISFDPFSDENEIGLPTLNDDGLSDTLNKCPKCGSPDITLTQSGTWICSYCRHSWDPNAQVLFDDHANLRGDIRELKGTTVMSAAENIALDTDQLTIKCNACAAEVVINTADSIHARCHWCRQSLSLNSKVPNGAVPDAILPFNVPKEKAVENIREFVEKRKFFALGKFTKEFNPENVMGVYLPYVLVDGNLAAELHGEGEIQTRTWTEKKGNSSKRYYAADVYNVKRSFDFQVDDLTVEASADKANIQIGVRQDNTNNIINAILPFDTKNAIPYNSAFMAGYNSERRSLDVNEIAPAVKSQFMSIARSVATNSGPQYEKRGIRWEAEHIEIKGTRWASIYLPVWLYSYYQQDKDLMHYVAVNGRTGETMGSVPVNYPKLYGVALALGATVEVGALAVVLAYFGLAFIS